MAHAATAREQGSQRSIQVTRTMPGASTHVSLSLAAAIDKKKSEKPNGRVYLRATVKGR
jgi:hypothetical protein